MAFYLVRTQKSKLLDHDANKSGEMQFVHVAHSQIPIMTS